MSESRDRDCYLPPEAPLDTPYQVLERRRTPRRSWVAVLRQLAARLAPHE